MIIRDIEIQTQVHQLLSALRGKIRQYAWSQGTALTSSWLFLAFLLFFALDYLPVRLGGDELSRGARVACLIAMGIGSLVFLYRFSLRRVWASISDRSAALLIERSHPHLQDRLLTVVELQESFGEFGDQMLHETRQRLVPQLANIQLEPIFDYKPLYRALLIMGVAAVAFTTSIILAPQSAYIAGKRLFTLSPELYPRQTELQAFEFTNGRAIAARGSDFVVRVRANANRQTPPPRSCTIHYRSPDGQRGRVNMSRMGGPREGFQQYVFDGKPFRGLLEDLEFDIYGGDAHLRGLQLKVVDSPAVTDVQLECEFPEYTRLVPKVEPYRAGMQLPFGTHVTMVFRANKPLVTAELSEPLTETANARGSKFLAPEGDERIVRYSLEELDRVVRYEVSLEDTDGLRSRRPQVIHLEPRADNPPKIDASISGIGTAVTADAVLPFQGTIQDDYGIQEAWIDLQIADQNPIKSTASISSQGELQHALDLRALRQSPQDPIQIPEGIRISVQARAADEYALGNGPQIGEGDRYDLEVVSAERLLALLEARELGLRQRFEQIIAEMKQSRASLAQFAATETSASAATDGNKPTPGAEPDDKSSTAEASGASGSSSDDRGLEVLRVQRVWQEVQRSGQEIDGVSFSFIDICTELDNNRIDAVERKRRLQDEIALPLQAIVRDSMPNLVRRLRDLEGLLARLGTAPSPAAPPSLSTDSIQDVFRTCLNQLDGVIVQLEGILAKMLDLESYNELVDLVRGIIQEQESLSEQTKQRQRENALELLKE
jgi:hypothetical protein